MAPWARDVSDIKPTAGSSPGLQLGERNASHNTMTCETQGVETPGCYMRSRWGEQTKDGWDKRSLACKC